MSGVHADREFVVDVSANIDRATAKKHSSWCVDDSPTGIVYIHGGPQSQTLLTVRIKYAKSLYEDCLWYNL